MHLRCPECGQLAPAGATTCPKDGTRLRLGAPSRPDLADAARRLADPPAAVPLGSTGERPALVRKPSYRALVPTDPDAQPVRRAETTDPDGQPVGRAGTTDPDHLAVTGPARLPEHTDPAGVPVGRLPRTDPDAHLTLPRAVEPAESDPERTRVDRRPGSATASAGLQPSGGPGLADVEQARTSQADPLVGQDIDGFVVQRLVGVGGMGRVYEAAQPGGGRRAALKVLRRDLDPTGQGAERLRSEARSLAKVRHPGVVEVYGSGQLPDGRAYLLMEFLQGVSLDRTLSQQGPLEPAECVDLLDQALAALGACHGVGLVHRDLKPVNLFLLGGARGPRTLKVLDFGIAKQAAHPGGSAEQTNVHQVVGTPNYLAPEQARGEAVSPRTDLYALGCIAWEMLTGQQAFTADTDPLVVFMHLSHVPPPPSRTNPKVPRELDRFVARLLEIDPARRPASAAEARAELARVRAALGGEPPGTQPDRPAVARRVADPLDRLLARPWLLAAVALGIVLLSGVVTYALAALR